MQRRLAFLQRLQRRLEGFYALERAPDVAEFVRFGHSGTRETLLLREADESLEMALLLPAGTPHESHRLSLSDDCLQLLEGVSHFVFIAERARIGLPATQLELELQAEVDKFVVLAGAFDDRLSSKPRKFSRKAAPKALQELHQKLYEGVSYLHAAETEAGHRYRLANDLAARFVRRVLRFGDAQRSRRLLMRFYRSGQADKIRLAHAA